jgi:hypothetical protein
MSLGSYWRNGRDKDQQAIAARHIGKKRKQKLAPPPRDIITIRTVTADEWQRRHDAHSFDHAECHRLGEHDWGKRIVVTTIDHFRRGMLEHRYAWWIHCQRCGDIGRHDLDHTEWTAK